MALMFVLAGCRLFNRYGCGILLALFLFCADITVYAQPTLKKQQEQGVVTGLKIGDKVPDVVFQTMRNYVKPHGRLSDFKGKFIILDFWSKYCSNCIAGFPHLQQLQEEFKDDLQVLLITHNTEQDLAGLFQRSPIVKATTLPMVLGDSILSRGLFPHQGEPYQVWLDNTGTVRASTHGFAATPENIRDLLAGHALDNVPLIEPDFTFDPSKPILTYAAGKLLPLLLYYSRNGHSLVTTSFPASEAYSLIMQATEKVRMGVVTMLRTPGITDPIGMRYAFYTVTGLYGLAYGVSRNIPIIPEGTVNKELFTPEPDDHTYLARWRAQHLYIYEQVSLAYNRLEAKQIMRADLARYFGLRGQLEKRPFPHMVIYQSGETTGLDTRSAPGDTTIIENTRNEQGVIFKNIRLDNFLGYLEFKLNPAQAPSFLLVNETGIEPSRRVDLVIKSDFRDRVALSKELARYGLGMKEEMRETTVLLLRKAAD